MLRTTEVRSLAKDKDDRLVGTREVERTSQGFNADRIELTNETHATYDSDEEFEKTESAPTEGEDNTLRRMNTRLRTEGMQTRTL